jgi:hypothetical protein
MMIKLIRARWAGHVARMGEMNNAYKVLLGKPKGNGRTILKCDFKK